METNKTPEQLALESEQKAQQKIETNNALLTVLESNNVKSVAELSNILALSKIGQSARNSLVTTVQKYSAMVNGEDCKDTFDDLSYDRLMQYGATLRKQAISNGLIEEPKRESLDSSANKLDDNQREVAPTGSGAKIPMNELILAQKARLRGEGLKEG